MPTENSPLVKRLGRKMKVGDIFESTSKRMNKYRWGHCRVVGEKVYKRGDRDYFVKDNRRYFCEVRAISKTTTGYHRWQDLAKDGEINRKKWPFLRWWQFTYVVKILEN